MTNIPGKIKCVDMIDGKDQFSEFVPTHLLNIESLNSSVGEWEEVNEEKTNWLAMPTDWKEGDDYKVPRLPDWKDFVFSITKLSDDLIAVIYKDTYRDSNGISHHEMVLYKGHLS